MNAAVERLKTICARTFAGQGPVMSSGCVDAAVDLLRGRAGVAVGEVHGDYAHARFMKAMLPRAAAAGVKTLYVEMFQQQRQDMLDRWQMQGDGGDLLSHINGKRYAYATYKWQHYWDVLETARLHGVRVVAIEPQSIPSPRHPGIVLMTRNIYWHKRIEENQRDNPGKFILYCGRHHLSPRESGSSSTMQDMLRIPGVELYRGLPAFMPAWTRGDLHHCWLPKAPDQTPISGVQNVRSAPVGGARTAISAYHIN